MKRWLILPALLTAAAAAPRPISETDLLKFRWAADPRISPDGAAMVYTLVTVNEKGDGYESALWLSPASGGAPRRLTAGTQDQAARWSPDGRWIAFVRSAQAADGKTQPGQIWLLPMEGGEARALTNVEKGASNPVWSPDGKRIAFLCRANAADLEKKKAGDPPSDVRVITRAAYRNNGNGYADFSRPPHIWMVDVPRDLSVTASARQVTKGPLAESEPVWSRDGSRLFFVSNRSPEPYYDPSDTNLYSVPPEGGEIALVADIDGSIRDPVLSPDGSRIAFVGIENGKPERSYSQPDLFITSLQPGSKAINLTGTYDFDISGGIAGDQHPPRGGGDQSPVWTPDGRFLIALASVQGRANLQRIEIETRKVTPFTSGDQDVYSFTSDSKGEAFAAAVSTVTNIGDIFRVDRNGRAERKTAVNQELFDQLSLTAPEAIWYDSFDGRKIQTWIQRPPDYDPARKYPLILNIHGGPHAAYGYTFNHEMQWMAAKGYIVLYPNPRGSTSYGQEFGNSIQHKYPGDDYRDLMAGVDELIRRGWVDPERMGVTGGSGGGLLTNWVITQTPRFRAAVSQRSIADWRDFWYTADFTLFRPTWFRGAPWQEEADFKARSPITYVEKIETPLLLVEGGDDLRTPPAAGGEQMFRALKFLRKPVAMVQFPGESHELSRSGKPRHRVERLQHIVGWMDKYVLGKDVKGYEIE